MLKNYLTIAFRNINKHLGYAGVNIFGLTIGITSFLLILIIIRYELNFDRFHKDAGLIYRINNELQLANGNYQYPTCTPALPFALYQELPEVTDFTRLSGGGQQVIIEVDAELYREDDLFFAEQNFLNFFNFRLIEGDEEQVLSAPNQVVLTQSAALKYFGTESVVGKVLTIKGQNDINYQVTGLLADLPEQTHLAFSVLLSLETLRTQANNNGQSIDNNWQGDGFYSYIKLSDPAHQNKVEGKFAALKEQHISDQRSNLFNPSLTPLTEIHLGSNLRNEIKANGSMDFVYIFTAVALFILAIAGINYMNLATARSAKRAKEVGIRKVLGAYKKQLITQFLGESLVLTMISAVISFILVVFLIQPFGSYMNRQLNAGMLYDPVIFLALIIVVFVIGVGSGLYPALFLSAFKPVVVLKGKLIPGMGSSGLFRKALVVFQFIISIVMIIGTQVVYDQLNFLKNKSLGFQKENILMVANTNQTITPQLNTFKTVLLQNPNVEKVTATFSKPGGLRPIMFVRSETIPEETKGLNLAGINVDFDYLKTMNIEMMEGRDFDPDQPSDSTNAIIINKKAAIELNMEDDALGRVIEIQNFQGNWQRKRIIGIVDDINFEPLRRQTESCFYAYFFPAFQHIFIRLKDGYEPQTISLIESIWDQFAPEQPFEYDFLEDDLNAMYQAEEELSEVIIFFALLAVFVACLGLFGLASFASEQRIKEVGVRKVLGASIQQVLFLLTKDFVLLVLLAFVCAAPLAYYLTNWWLQNFAFTVDMSAMTFLLAGLMALGVALLTVAYKTYQAARANPVKALRFE